MTWLTTLEATLIRFALGTIAPGTGMARLFACKTEFVNVYVLSDRFNQFLVGRAKRLMMENNGLPQKAHKITNRLPVGLTLQKAGLHERWHFGQYETFHIPL